MAFFSSTSGGAAGEAREGRQWLRFTAILALSAAIFAADLSTPRGVAAGFLYCALVPASIRLRDIRVTLLLTLLFTVLDVAGWVLSEPHGPWVMSVNRGCSVALIWSCGALVISGLREAERFRAAVEAAPAGMIVASRDDRILSANAEAEHILGVGPGGLRGLRLNRFLGSRATADEWKRLMASADVAARGPREIELSRLDGELFPAEASLRPMKGPEGPTLLVMIRDLTQVRRNEGATRRLAAIVRSSSDAIYAKDLDGTITDWNPGAERMFGYSADEIIGCSASVLFPQDVRGELDEVLAAIRGGRAVTNAHTIRRTKDGRMLDVSLVVSPLRDRHGRVAGASTIARDMTSEREAERLVVELNTALSHAMPGIATVDPDGVVVTASEPFAALTAKSITELPGTPWSDLLALESPDEAERAFGQMLREGRSELTARARVPEERYLDLFLVRRLDTCGQFRGFHMFSRDVTRRMRADAELRHLASDLAHANEKLQQQALVDPLTGLLNRRGLEKRLKTLREERRRDRTSSAVILIDVDDFKDVNGAHGHAAGDRVLAAVARSLEKGVRASDSVARIGGDEFLVVLPEVRLGEAVLQAERLRVAVCEQPVRVNGAEVAVTCSLGVSTIADAATTIEGLIESVRLELAESKSGGKNRVCSSGEAATATTPLGDVLNGHGLRAFHQPIYDLLEDRIVAFELLVRGPQGRYESPEVFLDLLRPGEGLTHLDIACLQTCVEAARKLPPDVCLHFNLFPSTLVSLGAERVASELRQAGPERRFCVELNERGTSGGSKELLDEVRALKAEGIQVAIDDVGFGASSLEALVHMEPDVIKLDRTCASGEIDARALERLLGVASVLRARVITEGIEDAEGLERLTALHVRYGQGYLWGRPEPVEADDPGVLWPRSRRVTPAPARDEREGREAAREAACRRTSA